MLIKHKLKMFLIFSEPRLPVRVNVTSKHDDILSFNPTFFDTNSSPPWNLVVRGLSPGHDIVSLTADGQQIE